MTEIMDPFVLDELSDVRRKQSDITYATPDSFCQIVNMVVVVVVTKLPLTKLFLSLQTIINSFRIVKRIQNPKKPQFCSNVSCTFLLPVRTFIGESDHVLLGENCKVSRCKYD